MSPVALEAVEIGLGVFLGAPLIVGIFMTIFHLGPHSDPEHDSTNKNQ